MKHPLALWHDVLPSGIVVFGPFDAKEDAQAPTLDVPSFHFLHANREFVVYSATPLSEADRRALLQKTAARLGSVTGRIPKDFTGEAV